MFMRNLLFVSACLAVSIISYAQNVGIGTPSPAAKLDVKTTTSPYVAQFNGIEPMYMGIFENDVYRGYWGSYSGNPEDVDFGTGSGTTGKLHLTIQASPKLTIDNTGKVGIGTTSPNYKLHVTGGDLFLQSSSGYFKIGYDGADQWRYATINGGADLMMQSSTDGTTFTPRHYFAQNGRVGIGTGAVSPGAPLEVSTTGSEVFRMHGAHPYMSFYDNTDGYRGYFWYDGTEIILGSSSVGLSFVGHGFTGLRVTTGGQVVVGTSNNPATGYKLSVDGKAICEELKVQLSTSWPDYVFSPGYKLLPIDDLEKSIMANKHLPNMPSAADVTAEKGFEVGDMNRRLLEKVEELTLYIIEINKQNKQLQEDNQQMENRLNVLETKLGQHN
jgi:hypothetical protein